MAEDKAPRVPWHSLTLQQQQELPPQAVQYRLTGPYGRIVYDAANQKSTLVEYKIHEMMIPTWEELDAHPDRFQEWPPEGTTLVDPKTPEEPPPDEPHAARSRR